MTAGVPRGAVIGGLTLVVASILMAAFARPAPEPALEIAQTRPLEFFDRADGAVVVADGATGDTVRVVPPGEGGFVRGALRALVRIRAGRDFGPRAVFELVETRDGRTMLKDPATAATIALEAFGPTNAAAFRAFLAPASAAGTSQ